MNRRRIALAPVFILCVVPWALAAPVSAQAPSSSQKLKVRDLVYRVGDLTYRIEDTGGRVQNLQVKETATQVRIDLSADVLFAFDKSDLLPKAQQSLAQAAEIIRTKATGTVRIDGYTDAKGTDAYNQRLSQRRAAAVVSWFKNQGHLADVAFAAKGFGAKNPVAPNTKPDGSDDPEGRQKNRRVEITITKS